MSLPQVAPSPAQSAHLHSLLKRQRFSAAEQQARELLRHTPGAAGLWTVLAQSLWAQGKDAVAALRQVATLRPEDPEAHSHLGNALRASGQLEAALISQRRATSIDPAYAEAHNNLGSVLSDLGRAGEALESFRRAVTLKPAFALAHANLANALHALGRPAEALESYGHALRLLPERADLYHQAGTALRELGRLEEALASHRKGLALRPQECAGHERLTAVFYDLGRYQEAAESCARALAIRPEAAELHVTLAGIRLNQNEPLEAEACCLRALALEPQLTSALLLLAELRVATGKFDEAQALLRRVVAIDPDMPEAWAALGRFAGAETGDPAWFAAAQRVLALPLAPRREVRLRYALGRYLDERREYQQAFTHYERANRLTRQMNRPYDREGHDRYLDLIIQHFDREWLERARRAGSGSERAVLVVGMWRSGTTLIEQILASHPAVHGAGELPYWKDFAERYEGAVFAGNENPPGLEAAARDYLGQLGRVSATALRVVDKMASNFMHLGLLHAALPQARFIHMQRDAVDTCLSIYFQDFVKAHLYANDLQDLAHYYRQYLRLMAHWRRVLPEGVMLEVPYEALVDDQAGWSRRVVEFVGLPWDARCLEFHNTSRTVLTTSKWQIRRALDRSSVARWRNYEPHIGPLLSLRSASASQAC